MPFNMDSLVKFTFWNWWKCW